VKVLLDEKLDHVFRSSLNFIVWKGTFRTPPRSFVLPRRRFSRNLKGMEVHFPPDVETRLHQVASPNGTDAEQLKDIVARMLENRARFVAGVQRGIEQAGRGELVEHKDVVNRIDRR
jgi:predicted transcriptional regulator